MQMLGFFFVFFLIIVIVIIVLVCDERFLENIFNFIHSIWTSPEKKSPVFTKAYRNPALCHIGLLLQTRQ